MTFSDLSHNLRIELDSEHYELSPEQIAHVERMLDVLREPVRDFPVSDLYITVLFHPRSHDFRVKTSLVLPGRTLATGDLDENLYPALDRCIRKLVKRVSEYKAQLGNETDIAKHAKGTRHEVVPDREPNGEMLEQAVTEGDYATFREATFPYEEPVRKRVGRWIDRYPELAEQIDENFKVADIVEEVFLNAFERFSERPEQVRLGEWLEQLIDPSIKLLLHSPDEELENISFARTLTGGE